MVYFNGAVVTDPGGGGEPDLAFLDPGIAGYCAELARRRGVYFHVFLLRSSSAGGWENRELLMAEEERDETEFYRKRTGLSPVIGDIPGTLAALGEKAPETPGRPSAAAGCIKGMFIAEPPVPDEIRTELEARYPGRLYLARSSRTFLEVMTAGVSKGRGLRLAMERRGLDPAGVIALGDEENDLPMFSAAGYSAAPASAAPQVRKAADFVFPSNAEDGVAAFLREIFDI
jgi:hydroxymethylpyrimidine pyrophosphatase-like HAD family hydrolase